MIFTHVTSNKKWRENAYFHYDSSNSFIASADYEI